MTSYFADPTIPSYEVPVAEPVSIPEVNSLDSVAGAEALSEQLK